MAKNVAEQSLRDAERGWLIAAAAAETQASKRTAQRPASALLRDAVILLAMSERRCSSPMGGAAAVTHAPTAGEVRCAAMVAADRPIAAEAWAAWAA